MLSTEYCSLVDFWITEYTRDYMASCLDVCGLDGMNEFRAVVQSKLHYADDTRSRNRRLKLAPETGVGFWRQFFTPVAKFLAPETNTDE